MLSKFKKSVLWNVLFTILFCCLYEKIIGSNNVNKVFHTLLYAFYYGEKIDIGQIVWVQFTQSISSSTKNTDISYVIFWSIVVRNACDHFKVPTMANVRMANFVVLLM